VRRPGAVELACAVTFRRADGFAAGGSPVGTAIRLLVNQWLRRRDRGLYSRYSAATSGKKVAVIGFVVCSRRFTDRPGC